MILYFADRRFNIIGQASTGLIEGLTVVADKKTDDVETGTSVFDCKILFDADTRAKVEECVEVGNYVLRNNGTGNELYTIIDCEVNTKKQTAYIYAEDGGMDLLNEVYGAYAADKAYPISHYIEKYALSAGFQIGINEVENLTRQLSWDNEQTATARIASVAAQFDGCEVSYSFDVNGLSVTNKYINIHKKRGADDGTTLRLNKHIDSIITTKSISNLATALQCTGGTPENSDFPTTLLGYDYDDGDFYVDGETLKSRNALDRWNRLFWRNTEEEQAGGHITKLFSCDALDQKTLCDLAIEELKLYCDYEVNYDVEIKELPDNVKVGDRVNIVDEAGELYLSTRILQLETSVADKEYSAVLGEHLLKGSGISQKVADLAAQFAKNSVSTTRALELAKNAKTAADAAKSEVDDAVKSVEEAQKAVKEVAEVVETARISAAAAQKAADDAQTVVDNVEEDITSLQASLANAEAAAAAAREAAESAEVQASEAKIAATSAESKAFEAKTASEQAISKADSAEQKATTAESAAEEAKTQADGASATAAAAKSDAEKAQQDINAFAENLTTLSNAMQADYARKTELTETQASLQSQITQNAAQITQTVSSVESIDETANNAQAQAQAAQNAASAAQSKADQATLDAQAAQTAADNAAQAAAAAQSEADAAKEAAEAAQSIADKAESDLEAAKKDLETVASRVDATVEEIAAAQEAVDAAQSAANAAKTDAQAAVEKANTAQTTANEAALNAEAAQTTANEAANAASLAQKTAEEAKGDATAAQVKADEAAQTAAEAQRTANTAVTNAATAQAKADQAFTDAAAAQQAANDADAKAAQAAIDLATAQQNLNDVTSRVDATAEEVAAAQAAVETAQAAADKAQTDAATAQSTADTAKSNAQAAQTAANAAQKAADDAQEAADEAQAAADKAQGDVDALAIRVTTAETNISQTATKIELNAYKQEVTQTLGGYYTKEQADAALTVKANEISASVSQTYATKQETENIQTDLENNVSLLSETIVQQEADILASTEKVTLSHLEKYVTKEGDGGFDELKENVAKIEIDAQDGISIVASRVDSVKSETDTLNDKYNEVASALKVEADGVYISKSNNGVESPYKVFIDDNELSIMANTKRVIYFEAQEEENVGHIPSLNVNERFVLFGLEGKKDANGNVNFIPIGG